MIRMQQALEAWGGEGFQAALRAEIESLPQAQLPLQQGLQQSSVVADSPVQAIVLSTGETSDEIVAVVSLFYQGVISGCNCADDPTPIDTLTENCLIELRINRENARTTIQLLSD